MISSLGAIVDDDVAAEVFQHFALLLAPARPGHPAPVLLRPLQGDVAGTSWDSDIYEVRKIFT